MRMHKSRHEIRITQSRTQNAWNRLSFICKNGMVFKIVVCVLTSFTMSVLFCTVHLLYENYHSNGGAEAIELQARMMYLDHAVGLQIPLQKHQVEPKFPPIAEDRGILVLHEFQGRFANALQQFKHAAIIARQLGRTLASTSNFVIELQDVDIFDVFDVKRLEAGGYRFLRNSSEILPVRAGSLVVIVLISFLSRMQMR
jgi:hypothetical protein